MYRSSDPADSLRKSGSVPGIPAFQDDLDAAPHLARRPGVGDLAAVYFTVDAQMSFDPGDGVDGNSFGHIYLSLTAELGMFSGQHREFLDKIEIGHELDGHDSQGDENFSRRREIGPAGPGVITDKKGIETVQGACQEHGDGHQEEEAQVPGQSRAEQQHHGRQGAGVRGRFPPRRSAGES